MSFANFLQHRRSLPSVQESRVSPAPRSQHGSLAQRRSVLNRPGSSYGKYGLPISIPSDCSVPNSGSVVVVFPAIKCCCLDSKVAASCGSILRDAKKRLSL